jgi:hypothetical protein
MRNIEEQTEAGKRETGNGKLRIPKPEFSVGETDN